jgi:hypothetical protein
MLLDDRSLGCATANEGRAISMTADERRILAFFRQYQAGPAEMLFFHQGNSALPSSRFQAAMHGLIAKRIVVKERPRNAYSLTTKGYDLSVGGELAKET